MAINTQYELVLREDEIRCADAVEELIPVWTLDEFDQFADLDSVRSAWARADAPSP